MQLKVHCKVKQSLCCDQVRRQCVLPELLFCHQKSVILSALILLLSHILSAFWIWNVNSLLYESKSEIYVAKSSLRNQWLSTQWQAKEVNNVLEAIRISAERGSDEKHNFPTISKLPMSNSCELSAVLFSRSQRGYNDSEESTQKEISIIKLKDQLSN